MRNPEQESHDLAPRQPAMHLAPPTAWMGDPNGLVHCDGIYHAFYQHNPHGDVWDSMHWRHAVSTDLLRWTDRGIALEPDEHGTIFSGSAVVDHDNTSGFGDGETAPLVAIFTHDHPTLGQRQSLASSGDGGATWTKYLGNPVLESAVNDFRDPKVRWFRSASDPRWVMSIAAGDRVEFYRSPNLIDWTKTGDFTADTAPALGVWECPDLIAIGGTACILLVSIIDAGPSGHSGVVAFTGSFDGDRFTASSGPHRLDHGPDFYAAQSFSNLPSESPIITGWMSSWRYANTHPSRGRRGMHSIPRTLALGADGRIRQTPALPVAPASTSTSASVAADPASVFDIAVSATGSLAINGTTGPSAIVDVGSSSIRLGRFMPGHNHPLEHFEMERSTDEAVRIIIDHGSVEIFADDGSAVMSALIFPGTDWSITATGESNVARVTLDKSPTGSP